MYFTSNNATEDENSSTNITQSDTIRANDMSEQKQHIIERHTMVATSTNINTSSSTNNNSNIISSDVNSSVPTNTGPSSLIDTQSSFYSPQTYKSFQIPSQASTQAHSSELSPPATYNDAIIMSTTGMNASSTATGTATVAAETSSTKLRYAHESSLQSSPESNDNQMSLSQDNRKISTVSDQIRLVMARQKKKLQKSKRKQQKLNLKQRFVKHIPLTRYRKGLSSQSLKMHNQNFNKQQSDSNTILNRHNTKEENSMLSRDDNYVSDEDMAGDDGDWDAALSIFFC